MHFGLKTIVVAVLQLALILLAGCATTPTHGATVQAVDTLERQADAFASDAHREASLNHQMSAYAQHAQDFANQAHDFRQAVATAGDQDVVLAFHSLWHSYHALSDAVSSAHGGAEFKPAMEAFAEVQRDVKNKYAYADSSLLTSGGYQFDPYYN
jgi:outer membrane murein-binding lipoprotein Lpp